MAAGAITGLAGCTGRTQTRTSNPAASQSPTTASAPTPQGSTAEVLPGTSAWRPSPRDVSPDVKGIAVRLAEVAATWDAGTGGMSGARTRLRNSGFDPALAFELAAVISDDEASVAQVAMAQYGGILAESASVLVVLDQWLLGADGRVKKGGTTLDIRLVADEPEWTVVAVRPARPGRRSPEISRAARRVLANDRVVLPVAARRDVRTGAIHDSVLRALTMLAARHRLDVSVLRSGHPIRVFGTSRTSNHTEGLAVDIWALDGRPIIASSRSATVADFMTAARDAGAYQVGGPVDPDSSGASFFSDDTHQDHIHLGFAG